ncbi:MAG: ParB/RepB/Spo0J family partition protein [Oscillospiraceae bacterium]|jgi:ParB family chromosome partitioning protein|nr:ParB/RepB/Spo0J family partition protein [Oscillospiraceae bacterium]
MANAKNRGLGAGLGALLGGSSLAVSSDFEYIPIEKIEPRRGQPRSDFGESSLEELASSIREHGVLSPLTVRPLEDGFYQIIAGERRWRAARAAGLSELPARIISADDLKVMEISLVENLQREDLNPVEEAAGYRALGDEFGLTQEEISKRMGKSRPAVANSLRLLSLPDELLAFIRSGELAAGTARALAGISDKDVMVSAAREAVELGLSTRDAERLAKKLASARNGPEAVDPDLEPGASRMEKINYMAEYERELSRALGRKVRISAARKNSGRVELEYYGDEDLERLIKILSSLAETEADA